MTGFIYKITNKLNGKIYIGKTLSTIEDRWKEHLKESQKERSSKRPLYDAIQKYGKENFYVEEVEECDYKILSEREIYWIEYYNSYHNGYNATLGGDGKVLYDYEKILEKFQNGMLVKEIAEYFECDKKVVTKCLKNSNIDGHQNIIERLGENTLMCDKNTGEVLKEFSSQIEAGRWLVENGYSKSKPSSLGTNIGRVQKGERKTCCGFIWK